MFSRFDIASKRVLRAAEQECRNHNHYYVGVEHLLLALLDEHDAEIEESLAASGIAIGELASVLRHRLGTNEERLWEGILVTPRARRVIELAEESAGEGAVEPRHLFHAIAAEGGGLAAELLRSAARNSGTPPQVEHR
jgi:ATP-dependent Clp protease ATP-binding subunit ClpC